MNALHQLVTGSVDYAGLFPPAALPLESVVENYASYQQQNRNQMLARLIVPAARLDEMLSECESQGVDFPAPWKISALVPPVGADDTDFQSAISKISVFNQSQQSAVVDTIEVRLGSPAEVETIAQTISQQGSAINAFLEIDWRTDPNPSLAAIAGHAQSNLFAKIRTGGVTEDLIPPAEKIATFLLACSQHGIGLKATAGLHHPLRGEYRLTYEEGCAHGRMHGFFNVFLAAAMVSSQSIDDAQTLVRLLESDSPDAFQISDAQIQFESHSVTTSQIEKGRSFLVSFGSCSFEEPSREIDAVFAPST